MILLFVVMLFKTKLPLSNWQLPRGMKSKFCYNEKIWLIKIYEKWISHLVIFFLLLFFFQLTAFPILPQDESKNCWVLQECVTKKISVFHKLLHTCFLLRQVTPEILCVAGYFSPSLEIYLERFFRTRLQSCCQVDGFQGKSQIWLVLKVR